MLVRECWQPELGVPVLNGDYGRNGDSRNPRQGLQNDVLSMWMLFSDCSELGVLVGPFLHPGWVALICSMAATACLCLLCLQAMARSPPSLLCPSWLGVPHLREEFSQCVQGHYSQSLICYCALSAWTSLAFPACGSCFPFESWALKA